MNILIIIVIILIMIRLNSLVIMLDVNYCNVIIPSNESVTFHIQYIVLIFHKLL